MRIPLTTAFFVSLACVGCGGTDKLIDVTPHNLDGWTTTTTVGSGAQSSDGPLVLAAGSQLGRNFSDPVVVVRLVTRPVFSAEDSDWQIFGAGPAALVFTQQDGRGRLMLVLNENTVVDLPGSFSGGSGPPGKVDVILAFDRTSGTALVSYKDVLRVFDVPGSLVSTEIWLSAGAKTDWTIDSLQVLLPDSGSAGVADGIQQGASSPGSDALRKTPANRLRAALDLLKARSSNSGGAVVPSATDGANAPEPVPTLEVFTPPSVRRVQVVNAVRNAVSQSQRK